MCDPLSSLLRMTSIYIKLHPQLVLSINLHLSFFLAKSVSFTPSLRHEDKTQIKKNVWLKADFQSQNILQYDSWSRDMLQYWFHSLLWSTSRKTKQKQHRAFVKTGFKQKYVQLNRPFLIAIHLFIVINSGCRDRLKKWSPNYLWQPVMVGLLH